MFSSASLWWLYSFCYFIRYCYWTISEGHYQCICAYIGSNNSISCLKSGCSRMAVLSIVILLVTVVGNTEQVGDCPPWFEWVNATWPSTNGTYCACSSTSLDFYIRCDQRQQQSSLRLASCVFYDSQADDVVVAACPFLFPKHMIKNNVIPLPQNVSELNAIICGNLSREVKGPLCGKCVNGTGPSIYSIGNECVPCSPVNVVYYLLLQYLPTTFIVLVVVVFRLNVTAAPMAHYVLFCNMIVLYFKFIVLYFTKFVLSAYYQLQFLSKVVLTLCAVWSFDALFFVSPPLCISPHLEDIYKPFIDFLAILYPFILLLLMYIGIELHGRDFKPIVILWKPFQKILVRFYKTWEPSVSMIQAFSSLFFLSYAKLLFVMGAPYYLSTAANAKGKNVDPVVYIDPTVPYQSKKHIYLIIFSLFIAIFLFLPPLVLLIIYPTSFFQKISRHLKPRWNIAIKIYVDTFQGCFKDGTNGTRDYRAVSGYLLAMWFLLLVVQRVAASVALHLTKNTTIGIVALHMSTFFLTILIIICVMTQPYKHKIANISAVTLLVIFTALVGMNVSLWDESDITRVMFLILLSSLHCALGGYVVWKIRKRCQNMDGEGAQLLDHNH